MTDTLREHLKKAGKLGGEVGGARNTEAQRLARTENLKRARWKRWHPGEPYPEQRQQ